MAPEPRATRGWNQALRQASKRMLSQGVVG